MACVQAVGWSQGSAQSDEFGRGGQVDTEALSGQILIYKDIKGKIELKMGRCVSDDYVWDLFKRHNWKKKVPRGSHPKSDESARQEYKKIQGISGIQIRRV
ncbi:hypothetical protein EZS27_009602 [termite gut metagenome]|uniref:Winged helix-turn helix domain-containing protein n=1 Tax=termite gut metagenome TaxID=433724 RepID=A0A5J4SB39_9ZZZZ